MHRIGEARGVVWLDIVHHMLLVRGKDINLDRHEQQPRMVGAGVAVNVQVCMY